MLTEILNLKNREVLTTGRAARICRVRPQRVRSWFDSGKLKGYKVPGSRMRHIPTIALIRFMGKNSIVIVDSNEESASALGASLASSILFVHTVTDSFVAGLLTQKIVPAFLVVSIGAEGIRPEVICKCVRGDAHFNKTKLIAITKSGIYDDTEADSLLNMGFIVRDTKTLSDALN